MRRPKQLCVFAAESEQVAQENPQEIDRKEVAKGSQTPPGTDDLSLPFDLTRSGGSVRGVLQYLNSLSDDDALALSQRLEKSGCAVDLALARTSYGGSMSEPVAEFSCAVEHPSTMPFFRTEEVSLCEGKFALEKDMFSVDVKEVLSHGHSCNQIAVAFAQCGWNVSKRS